MIHDPARRPPPLPAEEEADLARRAWAGDVPARHRIVEANLGFALATARPYQRRHPHLWDDLEGEALAGLARASLAFDPAYGTRFSTYAGYWVKQACRRYLMRHRTIIAVPVRLVDGSDGTSPALVEQAARVRAARFWSGDKATRAIRSPADRPDDLAARREEAAIVVEEAAELGDGPILRSYYGLGGAEEEDLAQLGRRLGVTASRVQQRRVRGVARLKDRLEARGIMS